MNGTFRALRESHPLRPPRIQDDVRGAPTGWACEQAARNVWSEGISRRHRGRLLGGILLVRRYVATVRPFVYNLHVVPTGAGSDALLAQLPQFLELRGSQRPGTWPITFWDVLCRLRFDDLAHGVPLNFGLANA